MRFKPPGHFILSRFDSIPTLNFYHGWYVAYTCAVYRLISGESTGHGGGRVDAGEEKSVKNVNLHKISGISAKKASVVLLP